MNIRLGHFECFHGSLLLFASLLVGCPSGCEEDRSDAASPPYDWQPVNLIHPGNDWDVTDIALTFS